jgi:hypothetical protein
MGRREQVIEVSTRIAEVRKELARLERRLDELLQPERDVALSLPAHPAGTSETAMLMARPADVDVPSTAIYVDGEAFTLRSNSEMTLSKRIVEFLDRHSQSRFSPASVARALGVPDGSVRVTLHRLKTEKKIAHHGRGEFCSLRHVCDDLPRRN